ncbi:SDR family oxidoreductase [Planktotalea sp.]|uniref:SDR family NAD(P)-dependent oxidoreductase n=1 Tax=Planktotalea sp. TaxID=2029877 RepID=UPI0025D3747A|nr:SDR family oxidoreductase [Planktotalea sp.]
MVDPALENKIAVITGAGRGIGKSTALLFAKAGADIAICARSKADLSEVRGAITTLGRRCFAGLVDLGNAAETETFCKDVVKEFGAVDIIVNNAGAYLERGAFEASDPDLWWKTMEVNVRGPYLITRHLIADMRKGGKIINLTSGKGYAAGANSSAYHVSKAALNMMTDGLANELWARDIDVNSLVPGPTATATFQNASPADAKSPEDFLAQGSEALPKGLPAWERVKHPDEVAEMALHLASQPIGGPTGQIYSLARRPM